MGEQGIGDGPAAFPRMGVGPREQQVQENRTALDATPRNGSVNPVALEYCHLLRTSILATPAHPGCIYPPLFGCQITSDCVTKI